MQILRDISGREFEVRERRPTAFGFDVLLGAERIRHPRLRVIMTPALVSHIADRGAERVSLPISRSTVRRIALEDQRRRWLARWFEEREADLVELGAEGFARRFKVTVASAERHLQGMQRLVTLYAVSIFGRRVSRWRARIDDADQDALDLGHATLEHGSIWYTVPAERTSLDYDPRRGPLPALTN